MKNLLCKYKQLLIGITIGSLITAIPVGAAVQEYILYKSECTLINSDGTKYEDTDYPVLSYKGSNYVSIGKVAQFLNVPFTWEGNTKTAKFEKPLASNTQNTKEGGVSVTDTKIKSVPEVSSENNPKVITKFRTEDNVELTKYKECSAIKYNDNIYVNANEYLPKILQKDKMKLRITGETNALKLYFNDKIILETVDANNTNYILYNSIVFINVNLITPIENLNN